VRRNSTWNLAGDVVLTRISNVSPERTDWREQYPSIHGDRKLLARSSRTRVSCPSGEPG
jgi:hypothetical protein